MDPITILLIAGVVGVAFLGLRGSGPGASSPGFNPYRNLSYGSGAGSPDITGAAEQAALGAPIDALAMAIPIPGVGEALSAVAGIVSGLLAAHQARLKDAQTENQAVGAAIPSFYESIKQIVTMYNDGRLSKTATLGYLNQLDQITYTQFRRFVGKTGTAWGASTPGVCDKTCTVACCVYNTWLRPDLQGWPLGNYTGGPLSGGPKGIIPLIQRGQGGTKGFAGIPTNKYNLAEYPAFSMTVKAG